MIIANTAQPGLRTNAFLIVIATMSGFAGLGYEIVWTRILANSLGHEIIAVLGVLVALFSGLALGSSLLGRRIAASVCPDRWYAGLELTMGLWAFAMVGLQPLIRAAIPYLVPVDASAVLYWAVAFGVPCLVLLPATLAMGATLPALEAILKPHVARAVGWTYAANTFGAVIGTLVTTFWIMPALGLSETLMALARIMQRHVAEAA